ncbi:MULTISPECIES: hypothetical protein [Bacillus]|uniref:Fur-regulated basic protein FbpA n=1 Tax=Bacillus stercoris TaxID=2054641 RepID=A0ABU0V224_9BACI|nr:MULTISPECIES: hypothetical protein [Bacillus]MBL3637688.1 hypothetical protein [Alkalicoccobacillus gibsonii]WIT27585.1 hypothetical protein [Bacillus phage SPbetaL5]MDQ1850975.1 hypothetical protein [Bacillus stercoris]MDY7904108.1 hypothetical protein [Bacillus sp. AG1]QGI09249.1 hypothetical protein GII79_10790 [Bacillus subtilis]
MDENKIIRRKSKRIHRARELMFILKSDIETLKNIGREEREYLLKKVEQILPYLKNEDREENKYNYDNRNG